LKAVAIGGHAPIIASRAKRLLWARTVGVPPGVRMRAGNPPASATGAVGSDVTGVSRAESPEPGAPPPALSIVRVARDTDGRGAPSDLEDLPRLRRCRHDGRCQAGTRSPNTDTFGSWLLRRHTPSAASNGTAWERLPTPRPPAYDRAVISRLQSLASQS
jgi:hypothetical protein